MPLITKEEVKQVFSYWEIGRSDLFLDQMTDDFEWTVMGTHPLSGVYKGKDAYLNGAFKRLGKILKDDVRLEIAAIYLDGNTATVELKSCMTANNGLPYNNCYCWIVHFNDDKKIIAITAYLDSALLAQVIAANE
jgi:ketosteroid isomerase-like protein